MGQAAVDLPDPSSHPPAPMSSADDLLAQLAGDEIDRLLATGSDEDEEFGAPMPAVDELDLPPVAPEADVPPDTAEQVAYAAQVDTLYKELDAIEKNLESVQAPAPAAPIAAPAVAEVPPPEQPTTPAERAALNAPVEEPAAALAAAVEEIEIDRTSIFVRVLEVINSPFAAVPDKVRDTLGKVAILTMMNSLGVILYLVLFRRHH